MGLRQPRSRINLIKLQHRPCLFVICAWLFMASRTYARQVVGCVRQYATHNGRRDYNAAVAALNTLQSNFSAVEAIRKAGPGWNKRAIPEMIEWVHRIGYEVCVVRSTTSLRVG